MRISRLKEDPGHPLYESLCRGCVVRVFVDGDQVRPDIVVTADDEKGMVLVLEMTESPTKRITHNGKLKRLDGQVRIKVTKLEPR